MRIWEDGGLTPTRNWQLSPELEDYFDYDGYGEAIHEECGGEFLQDGGYVYLEEGYSLEDILDADEDEGMTMGGM